MPRLLIFAGFTTSAFMMWAAWSHNPQGEFQDETGIHWGSWLAVGGTWFAVIGLLPWLITRVICTLIRRN